MAGFVFLYFYSTGYDAIYLFDSTIDFTERTYAISHFDHAPLLGFGINGFWTIPSIYDYFEQNHGWDGWVLDNYHSGYFAILIETGFLSYLLFAASVFLFFEQGAISDFSPVNQPRPLCSHHRIGVPQFSDEFHGDDISSFYDIYVGAPGGVYVGAPGGVLPCRLQAGAAGKSSAGVSWSNDDGCPYSLARSVQLAFCRRPADAGIVENSRGAGVRADRICRPPRSQRHAVTSVPPLHCKNKSVRVFVVTPVDRPTDALQRSNILGRP